MKTDFANTIPFDFLVRLYDLLASTTKHDARRKAIVKYVVFKSVYIFSFCSTGVEKIFWNLERRMVYFIKINITTCKKIISIFFFNSCFFSTNPFPKLDKDRQTYGMKESVLARLYVDIWAIPANSAHARNLLQWRRPKTGKGAGDFAVIRKKGERENENKIKN